jgi:hypothetical protein
MYFDCSKSYSLKLCAYVFKFGISKLKLRFIVSANPALIPREMIGKDGVFNHVLT